MAVVVAADVGDRVGGRCAVEDGEAGQGGGCGPGRFRRRSRRVRRPPAARPRPGRHGPRRGRRAAGSRKSGHRSRRASRGTGVGSLPSRYTAYGGGGVSSSGRGRRGARPRTVHPEGSHRTPAPPGAQVPLPATESGRAPGWGPVRFRPRGQGGGRGGAPGRDGAATPRSMRRRAPTRLACKGVGRRFRYGVPWRGLYGTHPYTRAPTHRSVRTGPCERPTTGGGPGVSSRRGRPGPPGPRCRGSGRTSRRGHPRRRGRAGR